MKKDLRLSIHSAQAQDYLDIQASDIAQIDDKLLRDLVGRLCEAECNLLNSSTKGVLWGGHQNAGDGGLDVYVTLSSKFPEESFIPRSSTGYQVKVSDMPKAEILKEMRPNGKLRSSIQQLIQDKGAYIIVSSNGSTAKSALDSRIAAMRTAIDKEKNHDNLFVDFYDRNRVATWVRKHPSVIIWLRTQIGRPLKGWQIFNNWANAKGGVDEEFLIDGNSRLVDTTKRKATKMLVDEGLTSVRVLLSQAGSSVRLVGLSGVGKTRFAQALFDERIGQKPLNKLITFYTDLSESPNPDPGSFIEDLVLRKNVALVIIDNCSPELHRKLTLLCSNTSVSLLTIEYDVKDDLPEETKVFRLEPASEYQISKLIGAQFSHISITDTNTIAKFSGGNYRVALMLARTIENGESLSEFRDNELFKRIFYQRRGGENDLILSAAVCSLVYSFQMEGDPGELNFLRALIEKSEIGFNRDINELKSRELIQQRGVWRAVLPHALANRLAVYALESIPQGKLTSAFINSTERLLTSFTRRLSYLHDCEIAVRIAEEWLAEGGLVGDVTNLSKFGIGLFENLAPLAPERVLSAIERALNSEYIESLISRRDTSIHVFVRLLKSIAYDKTLFDKSAWLLAKFAVVELDNKDQNSIRSLKSLFYLRLSGTMADADQRIFFLKRLMNGDENQHRLGLLLLDAALEAWNFQSTVIHPFGAHIREYGLEPKNENDVIHWFDQQIDYTLSLASNDNLSDRIRALFSNKFRALWLKSKTYRSLIEAAKKLHEQKNWYEGWVAIKDMIQLDGPKFSPDVQQKIHRLEESIRPVDLLQKCQAFVLSNNNRSFALTSQPRRADFQSQLQELSEIVQSLGKEIAGDQATLDILLPELLVSTSTRLFDFGKGMAAGAANLSQLWFKLQTAFITLNSDEKNSQLLRGFLSTAHVTNPDLVNSILDQMLDHDVLDQWLPLFQTSVVADSNAIDRINKSLDKNRISISQYRHLAWGLVPSLMDNDLAALLNKILDKPDGKPIALDLLEVRLQFTERPLSEHLLSFVREILTGYCFDEPVLRDRDHFLSKLLDATIIGAQGADLTTKISTRIADALNSYQISVMEYEELFTSIAKHQPKVFLDVFWGSAINSVHHDFKDCTPNPLDQLSDEDIVSWCEIDPKNRYVRICSFIPLFGPSNQQGKLEWLPIFYLILNTALDYEPILSSIGETIYPSGFGDPQSKTLEIRKSLFTQLLVRDNTQVVEWATSMIADIDKAIEQYLITENEISVRDYESFE